VRLAKDAWEWIERTLGGSDGPPDAPSPEVPDIPWFPGALSQEQLALIRQIAQASTKALKERLIRALLASLSEQQRVFLGVVVLASLAAMEIGRSRKRADA
jgi:hypothetical protein